MRQQLAMPRAWRLARASAIDPNPANVIARAGTFAASAPDGTVLVTRRDAEGLGHYIFAPDTLCPRPDRSHPLRRSDRGRGDLRDAATQRPFQRRSPSAQLRIVRR